MVIPIEATAQVPGGHTQNVLAGSRVFGTRGCSACHAIDGLGGQIGPDLSGSDRPQSFYGFGAAMWNHLPSMVTRMRQLGIERPRLTPWETSDLIAFLFWLDYFQPPGDAENGKNLFAEKGCLVCHQVGGVGGVVGPSLDFLSQYGSPIQVAAAMWNHGPAMSAAMQQRRMRRPQFSGTELVDIIAYLKASSQQLPDERFSVVPGRADRGRMLFEDRNCVRCHSVRGAGGTIGPDLAEAERRRSLIDFAAAMWNKAPAMTAAMRRAGVEVPQLRADEMADLLAYLYSIQYGAESGNPNRGRQLLRNRGCLGCHALAGHGATTASDLGKAMGLDTDAGVIAALWNHVVVSNHGDDPEQRWATFSEREMADLAAFLQTLGRDR